MKLFVYALGAVLAGASAASAAPAKPEFNNNANSTDPGPNVIFQWINATYNAINPTAPSASVRVAQPYAFVFRSVLSALKSTTDRQSGPFDAVALSYAAHNTLSSFYPLLARQIDATLKTVLDTYPLSEADAAAAKQMGQSAAQDAIQFHVGDGSFNYVAYSGPKTQNDSNFHPGVYLPTPPANAYPPVDPQDRFIKPLALTKNISAYLGSGTPNVTDPAYAQYVIDVKTLGSATGSNRTAHQTETAGYWQQPSPLRWNNILINILQNPANNGTISIGNFTQRRTASLFALYNYGLYDTSIADWENKYGHPQGPTWRPVTAIHIGTNGVPADPNWTPYLTTPDHPDYISNHAASGGVASTIIQYYFGTANLTWTVTANITAGNPPQGPTPRTYTNIIDTETDNANSRLYGGIHFGFSNADGRKVGQHVAADLIDLDKAGYFKV